MDLAKTLHKTISHTATYWNSFACSCRGIFRSIVCVCERRTCTPRCVGAMMAVWVEFGVLPDAITHTCRRRFARHWDLLMPFEIKIVVCGKPTARLIIFIQNQLIHLMWSNLLRFIGIWNLKIKINNNNFCLIRNYFFKFRFNFGILLWLECWTLRRILFPLTLQNRCERFEMVSH